MRLLAPLVLLCACEPAASPCSDGFQRGLDGNCYPIPVTTTDPTDLPTTTTGGPGPTTTTAPAPYEGPVYVEYASVRCTPDDAGVAVSVRTRGWAWRADIALVGTGVAVPAAEEHDLFPVSSDPDGWWDALGVGPLVADTEPELQLRNLHSRFPCADVEAGLLTYVVRVYDLEGARVDCAVWGHDEVAVRSGDAPLDDLTPPTTFGDCFDLDGEE